MESKGKCKLVDIITYFPGITSNTTTSTITTSGGGSCRSYTNLLKAQNLNAYKAADIVNLYLPPILIAMGIFFNVLSIMVMRSPYFRKVSTSVYLTAGAVNDVMGLVLALLPHWVFVNYSGVYPRGSATDDLCKFFNFYGFSNTDVTLSLTACMTADRAYAIKFPLRVASVSTVRRARYIILAGVLVVMVKNFHLWFASAMSPPESMERLCVVSTSEEGPEFKFYVEKVCPWLLILFLFICILVIVLSNVVIIVHVKRSARMNDVWNTNAAAVRRSSPSHSISSSGRLRQMTTMMLTESFMTLILSCPFAWYIHFAADDPNLHTDPDKLAMNQLLFSVFFYMLYSNKCVNFFLYFVSGYKFRLALRQLLLRCYCRNCGCHNSSSNNNNNNNNVSRDISIFIRPRGRDLAWRSEDVGGDGGDRRASAFNNNYNTTNNNNNNYHLPSVHSLVNLTKDASHGAMLLGKDERERRQQTGLGRSVMNTSDWETPIVNGYGCEAYEAEDDATVGETTAQREQEALGAILDKEDSSWGTPPTYEGSLRMIASTNTVSTMVGDIFKETEAGSANPEDDASAHNVSQPGKTPAEEQPWSVHRGRTDAEVEVRERENPNGSQPNHTPYGRNSVNSSTRSVRRGD